MMRYGVALDGKKSELPISDPTNEDANESPDIDIGISYDAVTTGNTRFQGQEYYKKRWMKVKAISNLDCDKSYLFSIGNLFVPL